METDAQPAYPPVLEQAWLELAGIRDGSDLEGFERAVAGLGDIFTTDRRAGFGAYAADDASILAYGLFYFPQTYCRGVAVLREVAPHLSLPGGGGAFSLLDAGAGTGACAFAAMDVVSAQFPGVPLRAHAVDRSLPSLELAGRVFKLAGRGDGPVSFTTAGGLLTAPGGEDERWDLITVSFALNELMEEGRMDAAAWFDGMSRRLSPGGVMVLIEPATRESCERMQALRDHVAARRDLQIVAPCVHGVPCPMRTKKDSWCHEVRKWRAPVSVEFLNRRLHRNIGFLKYSFLAVKSVAAEGGCCGSETCRLVSPTRRDKGRVTFMGCAGDGAIHPYEIPTRGMSGEAVKALLAIERGTIVSLETPALLGDGRTLRGGLRET